MQHQVVELECPGCAAIITTGNKKQVTYLIFHRPDDLPSLFYIHWPVYSDPVMKNH